MPTATDPFQSAHRYFAAGANGAAELQRLRLLERRADPITVERLRAVGIAPGWRCLEVGAGAGSVARWLAEAVGPSGRVTATDLDTRHLDAMPPGVEIRRHDITAESLEQASYDLVHCRSLLMHLPDPAAALERMVAALAPDGWLVVENHDYVSLVAVPGHPRSEPWTRAVADLLAAAGQLFATDFGRCLPGLVAAAGLRVIATDGRTTVRHGGDDAAQFLRRSFVHLSGLAAFAGLRAEIDLVLAGLDDPSFSFLDAINVGVCAVNLGSNRCP